MLTVRVKRRVIYLCVRASVSGSSIFKSQHVLPIQLEVLIRRKVFCFKFVYLIIFDSPGYLQAIQYAKNIKNRGIY